MRPEVVGIDHEALCELKMQMDNALQDVTKLMMRRGLKSGSVTAKVDIAIQEITTVDGEVVKIMSLTPDVRMKIGSNERIKINPVGGLYPHITDDGEVIAGDNQISMDEILKDMEGA